METFKFKVVVFKDNDPRREEIASRPITVTVHDKVGEDLKNFHDKDIEKEAAEMILENIKL